MIPKASQNGAKIDPKSVIFSSSFSSRFFFSFGRFFCCFSRCPTLDPIAIYSTFVGCAIFHKVRKSTKKDIQKPSNMTPKMQPKASKNAFKNEDKKQHEKLTILAPKMDPKWSQNGGKISPASFPGGIRKRFGNTDSFFMVLGCLWTPFGTLFDAFWASWEPFGLPQGAFWPP